MTERLPPLGEQVQGLVWSDEDILDIAAAFEQTGSSVYRAEDGTADQVYEAALEVLKDYDGDRVDIDGEPRGSHYEAVRQMYERGKHTLVNILVCTYFESATRQALAEYYEQVRGSDSALAENAREPSPRGFDFSTALDLLHEEGQMTQRQYDLVDEVRRTRNSLLHDHRDYSLAGPVGTRAWAIRDQSVRLYESTLGISLRDSMIDFDLYLDQADIEWGPHMFVEPPEIDEKVSEALFGAIHENTSEEHWPLLPLVSDDEKVKNGLDGMQEHFDWAAQTRTSFPGIIDRKNDIRECLEAGNEEPATILMKEAYEFMLTKELQHHLESDNPAVSTKFLEEAGFEQKISLARNLSSNDMFSLTTLSTMKEEEAYRIMQEVKSARDSFAHDLTAFDADDEEQLDETLLEKADQLHQELFGPYGKFTLQD